MDEIIDRQVAAYNSLDLDAFVSCYAEDVVVEDGRGNVLMKGHKGLRDAYGPFFRDNPELRAGVTHRIQIGSFVVDEERVTGLESDPVCAVVIYHVADDLIDHVRILR